MSGSDENRTITGWKSESRLYRRKPGIGWLLAFLAIPLLLALIGMGMLHRSQKGVEIALPSVPPSATLTAPAGPPVVTPDAGTPAAGFPPFSILRSANGFTLAGELPDAGMKSSLIEALGQAMPGLGVVDDFTVNPGVRPPDIAGLGGVFGAIPGIPDFSLKLEGDAITLEGTAPSEDVKAAVESAVATAWPNVKITNNIQVTAGSATAAPPASPAPAPPAGPGAVGPCATLQADITDLLKTPINFATDGATVAPDSQQLLAQIAQKVKACPSVKVAVTGHTDNTGNDAINVPLSGNRAKSVADELISDGISGDAVTSQGVGSANPVASNDTPAGRAQNRRVEITVS